MSPRAVPEPHAPANEAAGGHDAFRVLEDNLPALRLHVEPTRFGSMPVTVLARYKVLP
jgi:hypothetical protein